MKKFFIVMSACLLALLFTSCELDDSNTALRLYNDSPYTICMEIGFTTDINDFKAPGGTEIWLKPRESYRFSFNIERHYDEIVKVAFWVDYNGDGKAQYATTWHKGYVKNYPEGGYIYSKITVPAVGDVETTFDVVSVSRSIMGDAEISLPGYGKGVALEDAEIKAIQQ